MGRDGADRCRCPLCRVSAGGRLKGSGHETQIAARAGHGVQGGPGGSPGRPPPHTPVLSDSRRNAAEAVTWPVRVAAAWGWRLLVAATVIYALVQILSRVGLVVFPVIIALFLTAVLQSMMTVLELDAPARRW